MKKPDKVSARYDHNHDYYTVEHEGGEIGTIVRHPGYIIVQTPAGPRPKTYGECQFSSRKIIVDGNLLPNVTGSTIDTALRKVEDHIIAMREGE